MEEKKADPIQQVIEKKEEQQVATTTAEKATDQAKAKPKQPEKKEEPKKEEKLGTDEDFEKIDIRVGKLIQVWKHPESENLYCEKIDIGTEIREIASGLQKFIKIEDMTGLVAVMVNLKPRPLAGFMSNGMVMCAGNGDHTVVELLRPDPNSKPGDRIFLEGCDQKYPPELQAQLNPKKKILEKCLPLMKTDNDLFATFAGKKWQTQAGFIKATSLKNSPIS